MAVKEHNMRQQPSRAHATPLRVTPEVMNQIHRMIGLRSPELGGALGGDRRTGFVTHFHFDSTARATGATYSPDHKTLNRLFSDEWNPAGINLLGFVHSHPFGFRRPSQGDLEYARRILDAIPEMDRCLLPIVVSQSGHFEFLPFAAVRRDSDVEIDPIELELVDADTRAEVETRHVSPFEGPLRRAVEPAFARVENAYDLERLDKSRVICIGCGGAASFVEDLARAGVGEFILIDADTVSRENVATQQTYLRDIGRPKVECVAERIGQVNPRAAVIQLQRHLDDDLPDSEFESLLRSVLRIKAPGTERMLLCGFTDNCWAQARVNRLTSVWNANLVRADL